MSVATIKSVPGAWPVVGHTFHMLRNPLAFLRSLPAHGDLVGVRVATQKIIVVCDPDLTRELLTNDRVFDKGGAMYEWSREVVGNGIAGCPHADHRKQRRAVQPAFTASRISVYGDAMTTQCGLAIDSWRDGQYIDVRDDMMNLAARIFITTLFSNTLTASQHAEALHDARIVLAALYWRSLMPAVLNALPTPGKIRYDRARARLRETTRKVIAKHRATATDHGSLLSLIITPPAAESPVLSDTEVEDQVATFFLAGVETSANALSWTLHLLAQHPEIQRRLQKEIDTVLAGRPATVDHLPHLPLCGRIITESLRLFPPGWLFTRATTEDTRLGGKLIPAGSIVAYSPYLLHHRPDIVADPERFNPDRWEDHTSALNPRGPIIPFSVGPRKCIGDIFAMTEIGIALATISARFTVHPASNRRVRPALGLQLRPRDLRLRIEARQESRP